MPTPINQLSPAASVLTPSDISGVAQETTLQGVATDVAAIKTDVAALKQQATPIGAVKFHLARPASGGGYDLTWHDPNDTVIYGIAAAYWSHTVIVRKDPAAGESPSYPASPTDGVVVVDSHIRNQYLNTPFNDANGTSDSRYRAFPYATNGGYNDSAENQFDAGAIWTFGYILDEIDDNPATCITYIEDNADFAPLGMDWTLATPALNWGSWKSWCEEYFKPAMLTFGGEIDYYLNPDNLAEKADGTASDISNTSYQGNAMNIVKPIYCHIHRSGSTIEVRFSNARQTEDWLCWTHMKSDGTFAPFCAWPLFEGSNINSVLRSMATGAKPQNNTTQAQERTYAANNGSDWYTTTWADEMLIRLLFPLLCKTLNSQAVLGSAFVSGASSLQLNCGSLKDKGAFWGSYFDGSANITVGTKFLNMENIWGHRWRRPAGFTVNNGQIFVKMTPSTVDGSKTAVFLGSDYDDYAGKYIKTDALSPTSGSGVFITHMHFDPFIAMSVVTTGGSSSTGFTDAAWFSMGVRALRCGGAVHNGLSAGVFASALDDAPSCAYWALGASPSYHTF